MITGNETRNFIWQLNIPPKYKTFFWLLARDRILTNEARCKRGVTNDLSCSLCHSVYEDRNHIFRQCNLFFLTWQVMNNFKHNTMDFEEWLKVNLTGGRKELFAFTLWYIWHWRCASIFNNHFVPPDRPNHLISRNYQFWIDSPIERDEHTSRINWIARVGWTPPAADILKLNTNASCDPRSSDLTCDGLLRDDSRWWRNGFYAFLGKGSVVDGELWAILHGVKLARSMGCDELVVEADSRGCALIYEGRTWRKKSRPCSPTSNRSPSQPYS